MEIDNNEFNSDIDEKRPNVIACRLNNREKEDFDHLVQLLGTSNSETIRYAINIALTTKERRV